MSYKASAGIFEKAFSDLFEENDSEKEENEYNPNLYSENFIDEDEAWGDINYEINYENPIPLPEKTKSKPKEPEKTKPVPKFPEKDSKLVQKYFNIKPEEKPDKKIEKKNEDDSVKFISTRIEELNLHINSLKKECDKAKRLNIQLDEKKRIFNREKEELEKFEEMIRNEIQEFNEVELEKYKKELKVHERNQKVLANVPSKKERDEIEALRNLFMKVKEEASIKHNRYKLNKERILKLIDDAKQKRNELITRLEKLDTLDGTQSESISNPKTLKKPQEADYLEAQKKLSNNTTTKPAYELDIFENVTTIQKSEKTVPKYSEPNSIGANNPDSLNQYLEPKVEKMVKVTDSILDLDISQSLENNGKKSNTVESNLPSPPEYSESIPKVNTKTIPDGKIVNLYESGHKEIIYPNGTKKEEYPNGYSVLFYANNDVKQIFPDGKLLYFYAEANTTHTCLPSGVEIIRFGNGQIEKIFPDGSKKIKFVDGTVKMISADGDQETIYPDDTREMCNVIGEKIIIHPGGHKEFVKNGVKTRIYFNGTSKLLKK